MGMGGKQKHDDHGEVGNVLQDRRSDDLERPAATRDAEMECVAETPTAPDGGANRVKDPLTFLYYSIVLTTLTVICAIVIGIIQLLTLVLNVAHPQGVFWDGVEAAGDSYEIIGGAICASFIIAGVTSVLLYGRFKRWVDRKRARLPQNDVAGPPYSDEVRTADAEVGFGRRSSDEDGGRVIQEIIDIDGKLMGGSQAHKKTAMGGAREVTGEGSRIDSTQTPTGT